MTDAFGELEIPYVVGGSLAIIIYGPVRTTMDVDIGADIQEEQASAFSVRLVDAFYVEEQMIRPAIQQRETFNLIHLETLFKVDIFVLKNRPFDQQQISRRKLKQFEVGANEQI